MSRLETIPGQRLLSMTIDGQTILETQLRRLQPSSNNHNGCYPKGLKILVVACPLLKCSPIRKPPQTFLNLWDNTHCGY